MEEAFSLRDCFQLVLDSPVWERVELRDEAWWTELALSFVTSGTTIAFDFVTRPTRLA
jgi:hypothetical protein